MQGNQTHAPGGIAGIALDCHIGGDIAAVFNVGGFPERRVRASGIMMVPAQHHRPDFTVAHHLIKFQSDVHAPHGVLI